MDKLSNYKEIKFSDNILNTSNDLKKEISSRSVRVDKIVSAFHNETIIF